MVDDHDDADEFVDGSEDGSAGDRPPRSGHREVGHTTGGSDAEVHLRDVVGWLARNLVDEPDEIVVSSLTRDHSVLIRLEVAPGELGKVIGRQGRTARAIRAAAMIAGAHHDVRVSLDIEG